MRATSINPLIGDSSSETLINPGCAIALLRRFLNKCADEWFMSETAGYVMPDSLYGDEYRGLSHLLGCVHGAIAYAYEQEDLTPCLNQQGDKS